MNDLAHNEAGELVESVDFDYDSVDRNVFGIDDERESVSKLLDSMRQMLKWICQGQGEKAIAVRLQAVRYYVPDKAKNQEQLAKEIGVTKAAISQKVCELRDWLSEQSGKDIKSRGARSQEARKIFSEVCKSNHQKRKSNPQKSQERSTPNSIKPYDLVQKLIKQAEPQL